MNVNQLDTINELENFILFLAIVKVKQFIDRLNPHLYLRSALCQNWERGIFDAPSQF